MWKTKLEGYYRQKYRFVLWCTNSFYFISLKRNGQWQHVMPLNVQHPIFGVFLFYVVTSIRVPRERVNHMQEMALQKMMSIL